MKNTELALVALFQYTKYCKIISANEYKVSFSGSLSVFYAVKHSVNSIYKKKYSGLLYGNDVSV